MSSVYNFMRRHRRKLLWGGAAVGGVMIAARIMERQLAKAREEEGRTALERTRKLNHYQTTECTCNSTLTHTFHQLRTRIIHTFDSTKLTHTLRQGAAADDKVRIWTEIKLLSFCKVTAYIVAQAALGVLLRVQLNVLAGYLFTERVSVAQLLNNNRDDSGTRFPKRVQEKYLSLANYFISEGFTDLCEILLVNVKSVVDGVQLQDLLNLQQLENIFIDILEALCTEVPERNLFHNPGRFLLSDKEPSAAFTRELTEQTELETFNTILSETLEIMESQDVCCLLKQLCRQGFAHLTDSMADHFAEYDHTTRDRPENPGTSPTEMAGNSSTHCTEMAGDSSTHCTEMAGNSAVSSSEMAGNAGDGFRSLCGVRIPLAKLVPVISSLVQDEEEEEGDEWLTHIIESADLKLLGANIYETFCVKQKEEETATWFSYLSSSVSSYF